MDTYVKHLCWLAVLCGVGCNGSAIVTDDSAEPALDSEACGATPDRHALEYEGPPESGHLCINAENRIELSDFDRTIEGELRVRPDGGWEIACNHDCEDESAVFRFSVPDFVPKIPDGTWVRARIEQLNEVRCFARLTIDNLPELDGVTNPVAADDLPWFRINDGGYPASDIDLEVRRTPLCDLEESDYGWRRGHNRLHFSWAGGPEVSVAPGESESINIEGIAYEVGVVRSVDHGIPHDQHDHSYWLQRLEPQP